MARQSITLTMPNDDWLKAQVESKEYTSKSEVVNDLIRRARAKQEEIDFICAKLIESEKSGFINQTRDEVLTEFKDELRHDGKL
ncbi:MAG: CopG family transcriptional regulator [Gammaproteobacteria bacterium]